MSKEKPRADTSAESRNMANRKIINRLRRAHGQLAAVIAAVDQEAPCRDTVQQLAAVSKALDSVSFLLISSALTECLNHPESPGGNNPKELEKLFLTLA